METTDQPNLADLERAVTEKLACALEAAWSEWDGGLRTGRLHLAMKSWLDARRAAKDAGYVSVLVSREAVEALRLYAETNGLTAVSLPLRLLARDLAAVLKADGS